MAEVTVRSRCSIKLQAHRRPTGCTGIRPSTAAAKDLQLGREAIPERPMCTSPVAPRPRKVQSVHASDEQQAGSLSQRGRRNTLGLNLRPTSRICVITSRVASKPSLSPMNRMPAQDRLSSLPEFKNTLGVGTSSLCARKPRHVLAQDFTTGERSPERSNAHTPPDGDLSLGSFSVHSSQYVLTHTRLPLCQCRWRPPRR